MLEVTSDSVLTRTLDVLFRIEASIIIYSKPKLTPVDGIRDLRVSTLES